MDAGDAGIAFALGGFLTDQVRDDIRNQPQVIVQQQQEETIPFRNADLDKTNYVEDWDSFVGQEKAKKQLDVHIRAAKMNGAPMPHIMLASGFPGVGKTTLARLIAKRYGTDVKMLVPPFSQDTLAEAAMLTGRNEFLFIDEIHKLADGGPRGAENLLHMLEEGRLYYKGEMIELDPFTVIGATTDVDKLPETIIDRFSIKPTIERYSKKEMIQIVENFAKFYGVKTMYGDVKFMIASASRRTPRIAREIVVAHKAMYDASHGITPWGCELLEFVDIEPNGMGAEHRNYVIFMYSQCKRVMSDGSVMYTASEGTLKSTLRMPPQGLARTERFLLEIGMIGRGPQGRYLTERGIHEARKYLERSK
jgi:Holliday junction DNA helicase RuvB